MDTNRVSATVTTEQKTAQAQAVATLAEAQPYLISLTKEERIKMLKFSSGSADFVTRLLPIAEAHQQYLPPAFDLAEWRKDVELLQAIRGLMDQLSPLLEKMDDTLMVAGSEAYAGALTAYGYLKQANLGSELEGLMDDLGKRFARKSRAVSTAQPTEAGK
jgi:hypothetical protein